MPEIEDVFGDAAVAMLEGYPAVHATVVELIRHDLIAAARLLSFVTAMAEHRGAEADELRLLLGLRPMGRDRMRRQPPRHLR
jgi:hypothetical protein